MLCRLKLHPRPDFIHCIRYVLLHRHAGNVDFAAAIKFLHQIKFDKHFVPVPHISGGSAQTPLQRSCSAAFYPRIMRCPVLHIAQTYILHLQMRLGKPAAVKPPALSRFRRQAPAVYLIFPVHVGSVRQIAFQLLVMPVIIGRHIHKIFVPCHQRRINAQTHRIPVGPPAAVKLLPRVGKSGGNTGQPIVKFLLRKFEIITDLGSRRIYPASAGIFKMQFHFPQAAFNPQTVVPVIMQFVKTVIHRLHLSNKHGIYGRVSIPA